MNNNVNSVYFDKEQAEEMLEFIASLNKQSYGKGSHKFEILISPADCGAFNVDFIQVPWDGSFGGHFEYVEEDQVVMIERVFPDNHYELCYDEEDYKTRLEDWLQENPGWVKNSWGMWYNEIENDRIRQDLFAKSETENTVLDSNSTEEDYHENGVPQQ